MAPLLAPVNREERHANLDVLRAIALFGVLMINLLTEFRVSIFAQFLGPASGTPLDRAVDRFVAMAVEQKAFVVFSLLFGVGLEVQLDRVRQRAAGSFARYASRRLGALLAIGLVHLVLVWNGDILTEYAVAGLLFAPLLRLPTKALVAIAGALLVLYVAPLPWPDPFPSAEALAAHVAAATRTYAHGSFADVLAFRIRELPPILVLDLWALPRTLGLFALGAASFRAGLFARPAEHHRLLIAIALGGVVAGGAGTLASYGMLVGEIEGWGAWASVIDRLSTIGLAFGYTAVVLLACERPSGRTLLAPLAPLGRMALTSYLTQSLAFGLIFYGYGFGWFGAMSVARAALLGVVFYAAQVAFSAWWLRRFHFGPVEWIWRSATYGAWQPMARSVR